MSDADVQARATEAAAALRALGEHVTPDMRMRAPVAAVLIGIKATTLRNWRNEGKGPTWTTLGGQPWYRVADVVRWLDAEERAGGLGLAA